ncbi:hypothetical protein NDU88_000688 [Pleurodeles waltl]|uniref:Uncharacterized protein n=1 Tax=Pleurodeles waltl TaxID=8319 RepID=A0AAV7L7D0_PLEWA|nr:hypothetical protein NDU88_000688 [Pleurodeles waltl]
MPELLTRAPAGIRQMPGLRCPQDVPGVAGLADTDNTLCQPLPPWPDYSPRQGSPAGHWGSGRVTAAWPRRRL